MPTGTALRISMAAEALENYHENPAIIIYEKKGETLKHICRLYLNDLEENMATCGLVRLAQTTHTTFIISIENQQGPIKSEIQLRKNGCKLSDHRTTPEPRPLAWLDVKIVHSKGQLSIISQSGPNNQQANKGAIGDALLTKTLSAVLNFLGCNPAEEPSYLKEEDRRSPATVLDFRQNWN